MTKSELTSYSWFPIFTFRRVEHVLSNLSASIGVDNWGLGKNAEQSIPPRSRIDLQHQTRRWSRSSMEG